MRSKNANPKSCDDHQRVIIQAMHSAATFVWSLASIGECVTTELKKTCW